MAPVVSQVMAVMVESLVLADVALDCAKAEKRNEWALLERLVLQAEVVLKATPAEKGEWFS